MSDNKDKQKTQTTEDEGNYYQYSNKGVIYKFDLDQLTLDELRKFEKMSEKQRMRFIASYELNKSAPMFDEVSLKAVYAPYSKSNERYADYAIFNKKYTELKNFIEKVWGDVDGTTIITDESGKINNYGEELIKRTSIDNGDIQNAIKQTGSNSINIDSLLKYLSKEMGKTEIYESVEKSIPKMKSILSKISPVFKSQKEIKGLNAIIDTLIKMIDVSDKTKIAEMAELVKKTTTIINILQQRGEKFVRDNLSPDTKDIPFTEKTMTAFEDTLREENKIEVANVIAELKEVLVMREELKEIKDLLDHDTGYIPLNENKTEISAPTKIEIVETDEIRDLREKKEKANLSNDNEEEIKTHVKEIEDDIVKPRKENNNNIYDLRLGPENRIYLNASDAGLFEIFSEIFGITTDEGLQKVLGDYFLIDRPKKSANLWKLTSKVEEIPYDLTYSATKNYKPYLLAEGIKNNITHNIFYDDRYNSIIDTIYDGDKEIGKYEIDLRRDEITKTLNGETKEPIKLGTGYAGSIFSKIKNKIKNKLAEISQPEINKLWDKISELETEIKELKANDRGQKYIQRQKEPEEKVKPLNDKEQTNYNFLDDIKKFDLSELIKPKPIQPKIEEESDLSKILSDRRKDIEYSDDEEEDYDWGEGYKAKPKAKPWNDREQKSKSKTISLSEFLKRYS